MSVYKNLVFEGGGVKGVAYIGVLEVLDKKGITQDIEKVAGTSAGAIVALLVGLEFSISEIRTILFDMNFKDFMDDKAGIFRDTAHFTKYYGYCEGEKLKSFIENLLIKKNLNKDITFEKLYEDKNEDKEKKFKKDLNFIGSNISFAKQEIFSLKTTPNMKIAEAVLISASYPFVFPLKNLNSEAGKENIIYCDGGLINNYPIRIFDLDGKPNPETLGFKLSIKSSVVHKGKEIDGIFDLLKQIASLLLDIQTKVYLNNEDWERTVFIDTLGVETLDFELEPNGKNNLIDSGEKCTEKYFSDKINKQNSIKNNNGVSNGS